MLKKIIEWFKYKLNEYRINSIAKDLGVSLSEWQYDYILKDRPIPQIYSKERGVGKTTAVIIKILYKSTYAHNEVSPKVLWEIIKEDPNFKPTFKSLNNYHDYYLNMLGKVNSRKVFKNRVPNSHWYKIRGFMNEENNKR